MKKLKLIASYVRLITYLVFILTKINTKYFSSTIRVEAWKSNGISEESIENFCRSSFNTKHKF